MDENRFLKIDFWASLKNRCELPLNQKREKSDFYIHSAARKNFPGTCTQFFSTLSSSENYMLRCKMKWTNSMKRSMGYLLFMFDHHIAIQSVQRRAWESYRFLAKINSFWSKNRFFSAKIDFFSRKNRFEIAMKIDMKKIDFYFFSLRDPLTWTAEIYRLTEKFVFKEAS